MAAPEPSLQELSARYESDSAGSEVDDSKAQEAPLEHATPEQGSEPVLSLTQALFGDPDFRRAAEEAGSDDEDEEDDDDDDLASALAWADFQDGTEAHVVIVEGEDYLNMCSCARGFVSLCRRQ